MSISMCFWECKQHACEGQKRAQDCLSLELQVIARLLNCGPLEEQQVPPSHRSRPLEEKEFQNWTPNSWPQKIKLLT